MPHWMKIGGTAAMICIAGATTAQADVTAQQVWDNWKSMFAAYPELEITSTEAMSGDTLTISNYTVRADTSEGGFTMTVPQIAFKEMNNGTVSVTMSDQYPVHMVSKRGTGEKTDMTLMIRQPGLTLVAHGDEADTTYDFSAPTTRITMDKMVVNDTPADVVLDVAVNGMAGFYNVKGTGVQTVTSAFNADTATLEIKVADPEKNGTFALNADVADLKSSSESSMGEMFNSMNMADSLKAGFEAGGVFSHGAMAYDASFRNEGSSSASKGAIASGTLDFKMGKDQLEYGGTSSGVAIEISGTDIPFPSINVALAESAFNLLMPITRTDTPKDFGLLVKLAGLSVSDDIWNIFDPTAVLPRDPATLVMDFAGRATWLVDILNPEVAGTLSGKKPGEVQSLTLNDLTLQIAGADLTGTGDFTFDNTDLATFDGFPKPTGAIDLKLVGGNGLIDKLVAMGLVPQDQAMGARMMMGLFARPVEGAEDTLTSQIEVKEDGSVVANGQRLR
ncbi:DUF2125 domain-containing protein [Pseudogemmobacter sp. W21_MBD1_M6]|uniref:DUF2125 domain-containing protein n=1 Tax=Pseudogemmobacter sp. W21_MBD1_M6 TaxID=3240271 RepID=UPI003F97A28F